MEFEQYAPQINQKIAKMMDTRGWKVYKLAQETGINAQTIYNWFEQGAVPTLRYLYEVCFV